jgi:hypothetical protein
MQEDNSVPDVAVYRLGGGSLENFQAFTNESRY